MSFKASFTSSTLTNLEESEQEVMEEAGRGKKEKRRGWGCLSGHHVDLIDHSRTRLICTHTHAHMHTMTHTKTLSNLINM